MDLFSLFVFFSSIVSITVILSTIPMQLHTIWAESNKKYRMISWVMLIGTLCLIAINVIPLLYPLFYKADNERVFINIIILMNSTIALTLGILAHIMYRMSKNRSVPYTIDVLDNRTRQNNEESS